MRLLLCREGYTNEERARCCLQNKQKSCGEMNGFPEMDIVESCSERKKLHTSLETQPEHVPRVKSSQRSILLIHALSIIRSFCRSLTSFYLSAFNSFLAIFFWDQAGQFFGLTRCPKS